MLISPSMTFGCHWAHLSRAPYFSWEMNALFEVPLFLQWTAKWTS